MVYRVYVEKKPGLRHEATGLMGELRSLLGITALENVRVLNRYDVELASDALFDRAVRTVFSEPQVDDTCFALPQAGLAFAVEPLPGQYDQRASSREASRHSTGLIRYFLMAVTSALLRSPSSR